MFINSDKCTIVLQSSGTVVAASAAASEVDYFCMICGVDANLTASAMAQYWYKRTITKAVIIFSNP